VAQLQLVHRYGEPETTYAGQVRGEQLARDEMVIAEVDDAMRRLGNGDEHLDADHAGELLQQLDGRGGGIRNRAGHARHIRAGQVSGPGRVEIAFQAGDALRDVFEVKGIGPAPWPAVQEQDAGQQDGEHRGQRVACAS
jgi:hypothetical protein